MILARPKSKGIISAHHPGLRSFRSNTPLLYRVYRLAVKKDAPKRLKIALRVLWPYNPSVATPSLIWYTDVPVTPARAFTPDEVCDGNKEALLDEPADTREIERILEKVRSEEYPDLPSRLCSVIALPFPYYEHSYDRRSKEILRVRMPEPFGNLPYCYWIQPTPGFKRYLVDESFVAAMFMEDPKYWKAIARDYWEGALAENYTYLIEGGFTVVEPCVYGTNPALALKWEA